MQLKPEEISKLIKEQIKHYENRIAQDDVGTTIMIGDGIARVDGLKSAMAGELLECVSASTGKKVYGLSQNLEEDERDQYIDILSEIAASHSGDKKAEWRGVFRTAFLWHKKKKKMIS